MLFKDEITRRHFILTAGAFAAFRPMYRLYAADAAKAASGAENTYIWGLPLVLANRYRALATAYPVNQFTLSTKLSSPGDKVAGPNVDTLYGFAFLDVSKEPLILHVPDTGDRYYSIHFIDAYQNSFAYVGRRATGTREGEYAIAATGWKGTLPPNVVRIDAPTSHLFALTRTLVRGNEDLAAAQAIQLQYTLRPLSAFRQAGLTPRTTEAAFNVFPVLDTSSDGSKFFRDLSTGVAADPPSSREKALLSAFANQQLPELTSLSGVDTSLQQQAATQGDRRIREADFSTEVNGWKVNYRITSFMEDPLLRASVCRIGPGAHIAQEALYFAARADRDGKPLTGESSYQIHFPQGGLPPVDAFWSLILYGPDHGLVSNPIQRYSISDRTEGLVRNPDGSLDIWIQTDAAQQGNWLPAPRGPFYLILRTYQPRPELFNGGYQVPAINRL